MEPSADGAKRLVAMEDRKAFIVGISGCSSSGKTTLARLLRKIFPSTMILHEDDFYKPETDLPIHHGFLDWDCAEAISIPDMEKTLAHIHATGTFPVGIRLTASLSARTDHGCSSLSDSSTKRLSQASLDSKEDQNSVGRCPVSDAKIEEMKERVAAWLREGQPGYSLFTEGKLKLCLFDGFLLYSKEMVSIMKLIDLKLFLLVSKEKASQRREARDGYVTIEGFWKDPPGYVENIVWPNYARAHAWLFESGDVEGALDEKAMAEFGIVAQLDQGLDVEPDTTLEWAVEQVITRLEEFMLSDSKASG